MQIISNILGENPENSSDETTKKDRNLIRFYGDNPLEAYFANTKKDKANIQQFYTKDTQS